MSILDNCKEKNNNVGSVCESSINDIKECKSISDIVNYIVTLGVWEMYTYEWIFNRRTFLYYNTLLGSYYFYDKNNNLILFSENSFFFYVYSFENTEFISNLFFKKNEKKKELKLTSYAKTMQGRRKKQEDRYIIVTDLTKYIDSNDYKTLFFYKKNPLYFFSIFDGHRGIKACEYCMNNIIKNIIYYFYNQDVIEENNAPLYNLGSTCNSLNNSRIVKSQNSTSKIQEKEKNFIENTKKNDLNIDEKNKTLEIDCININHFDNSISSVNENNVTNKNEDKYEEKNLNKNKDENLIKNECLSIDESINRKKRKIEREVIENKENCSISKENDIINNDNNSSNINEGKENFKNSITQNEDDKNSNTQNKCNNNSNKKLKILDDMTDEEIIENIKLAFIKTDEQFLKVSKFPNHGCTIISLIILKNKMFIANLGDCRAIGVVNLNNTLKTEILSYDHKPNDPKEKERIKKMGGDVICLQNVYRVKANTKKDNNDKPCLMERLTMKEEVYLAVSRAIGDKDFKYNNVISAMPDVMCKEIYKNDLNEKSVDIENIKNTEPEVKNQVDENYFKENESTYYSSDELNYHFVVMACDGVWDTLSNKDIAQILQTYQHDPDKACSEIIKTAYAYGSQDNLTAMLLKFY
ncbi:protein phosphatase PPM9, putative [Plasmodium gallinaceum]|uniref:protein-serine/threonine phosphatase n=1 Tax=Plasmodium gallinaceum TaxID=5849 RepID=A0A1J1GKX7_PLAGA|nr:protein phosphatase PPM9, putative [Plasmodium gallinaceum]CRG92971.1 protein phosphatase PPM9, putative [Plasmodium gallinaceum]